MGLGGVEGLGARQTDPCPCSAENAVHRVNEIESAIAAIIDGITLMLTIIRKRRGPTEQVRATLLFLTPGT
jgi:hypothetical protein